MKIFKTLLHTDFCLFLKSILKTSKNPYEVMFWGMQKYIYSESLFNTLYIAIKYKRFPYGKINVRKSALFFCLRASAHHGFIFDSRFLYELKHKIYNLPKIVRGISHFQFRFVFAKVYFFDLKTSQFLSKLK